jgi:hypothetical protein
MLPGWAATRGPETGVILEEGVLATMEDADGACHPPAGVPYQLMQQRVASFVRSMSPAIAPFCQKPATSGE